MEQYYAPDFEVKVQGLTLEANVKNAVINLTYDNNLELADMFQLTLNNADLRLTDSPLFNVGKEVEIHMGYVGDLKPMMLGDIVSVQPSFPSGSAPTIAITGYDKSHRMRHNNPGRFEFKWIVSGIMAAALIGAVYVLNLLNVSIPWLIVGALIVTLVLFWFLELKYAMGAIVALIHDVTITVGLFSIFDKEFTLAIIAALLTIIGYSLNDTIIVFDRIRENLRKYHKNPLEVILNRSVNETLSRTLLTSLTTLFVVVTLFVLGGGIIHDFAFALIIGVIVGTYSSIFVASPILLAWQGRQPRKK